MNIGKKNLILAMSLYLASSSLVLLWYKKIASPLAQTERVLFVLSLGAGILLAALLCDGILRVCVPGRVMILACGILACISTPLILLPPFSRIALVLSGLFGGALFILLQYEGLRNFPFELRCVSFGVIFASAGLVNTLTDLKELPALYLPKPPGNIILATSVVLLGTFFYAALGHRVNMPTEKRAIKGKYGAISMIATIISCVAYIVFSIKDSTAYPEALNAASPTGWIRLIEVPLFIGIGWLCDRLGRHVMLISSICMALLGTAGILFAQQTGIRVALEACSLFSMIAFSISICVILGDLSHYAKHPALMISMGFAPLMLSQMVSLPLAALENVDRAFLFIIAFLPGVCLIPAISLLLGRIRRVYSSENMQQSFSKEALASVPVQFGLTKRETQVYELILEAKTVTEISQALYLTESTVKQHITKILKKTEMENRAQLIKEVMKSKM